jgi:hypothetical protein
MRLLFLAGLTAALGGSASAADLEITHAVARVTIVPEARHDIRVDVTRTHPKLPIKVRPDSGGLVVDGNLRGRISGCRGTGQSRRIHVRGVGDVAWADLPQVVVRTPREVIVQANGAVFGSVGRSASLTLRNAGCGDWTVANVDGEARIIQAGSGDTRIGAAGRLKVTVAGSGSVAAADVKGPLDVTVAGSGSTDVRSISGPMEISVAGSGDVRVRGGRATDMKVEVAGSGDVEFGGVADTLRARIAGSGDVRAREVRGEVSRSIKGSGRVEVGE